MMQLHSLKFCMKHCLPAGILSAMRRTPWFARYSERQWQKSNPFFGTPAAHNNTGSTGLSVGIVSDRAHNHRHYIAACNELDIGYRVIDILADDWMDQVNQSGQNLFFIWPSVQTALWKTMFDERIDVLTRLLGKTTVPSPHEIWLYESKRRIRDWLQYHRIPHPETHVFTDQQTALGFCSTHPLPLVFKADRGGGSSGVVICRDRSTCRKLVKTAFSSGFLPMRWHPRDRQWGLVLFQEYIPDAEEWRIVRIGNTYMCRFKEKCGDFHSGSGHVRWAEPPAGLLDLSRVITEKGRFTSMNIDFFRDRNGRFLVNEIHALFGDILPANRASGEAWMGKWDHAGDDRGWVFAPGYYYSNACANLRIRHALNLEK
ncbi:hypothetical protein JXA80_03495 [bacterium]|nr:hypothetical protein [candidate division CSSED10-310 bacterium]